MSGLRVVWTTSGKTSLFPKSTSMFQPVVPPRIDDPTLHLLTALTQHLTLYYRETFHYISVEMAWADKPRHKMFKCSCVLYKVDFGLTNKHTHKTSSNSS